MAVTVRNMMARPRRYGRAWAVVFLGAACLVAGCATIDGGADRRTVSDDLFERTGFRLRGEGEAGDFSAVTGGERLTEEQAVDVALQHNAAFGEQLAELGLTTADVVQAGLIANPDALLLIPVGPKQLEATITAPLEALWLRGPRIAMAKVAADRAAARLTQLGVDLIRDVRLAYADLVLAQRRLAVFEDAGKMRDQVSAIAQSRVRAGDAIPLDAATARIDALRATVEARSLAYGVTIAEERLRAVMGAGRVRGRIRASDAPDAMQGGWDADALVRAALLGRADVRSAELAETAARERAALARWDWINISFVADANERGSKGFEAGPGFRFTLPIFNQNQGLIARADAELARAQRQRRTLEDKVILDVREAHARLEQAREDLRAWRDGVLPALDDAVKLAEKSYRGGETSLVQLVDTNRQALEARVREAQAASDLRRARAELERSVGRRLEAGVQSPTTKNAEQPK